MGNWIVPGGGDGGLYLRADMFRGNPTLLGDAVKDGVLIHIDVPPEIS